MQNKFPLPPISSSRCFLQCLCLGLFCTLLLFFSTPTLAQQRGLDESRWEQLTKGLDYSEKRNPNTKDRNRSLESNSEWLRRMQKGLSRGGYGNKREQATAPDEENELPSWNLPLPNLGSLAGIVKLLLYLALIAFASFIVYYLVVKLKLLKPKRQTNTTAEDMANSDDASILESDIERMLREALAKGDYRLSIRLLFLNIIQNLTAKEYIIWEKQKTNSDYLKETQTQAFHPSFQQATSFYEQIWYGERQLNLGQFEGLRPAFNDTLTAIPNK